MFRFLIIFFVLLPSLYCPAQQLYVENYTPADGLLDTRVIKMFQDDRGLMYFLTWTGISIFDGQRFENIDTYKGEPLDRVTDMIQWNRDTCYVFTFWKGVYQLVNQRLTKDTLFDSISDFNQVIQTGNRQWIITTNSGIYKWKGPGTRPVRLLSQRRVEKNVDYAVVKNGYLVYTSYDTVLYVMNLEIETVTDSMAGMQQVNAIICDEQTPVYIALNDHLMQLNEATLQQGRIKTEALRFLPLLPSGFQVDGIFPLGKKLWLRDYRKGWILLNTVTGEQETSFANSNIDKNATLVFTDKENNHWFSTFYKQVQKASHTRIRKITYNGLTTIYDLQNNENGEVSVNTGKELYLLRSAGPQPAGAVNSIAKNAFHWQGECWTVNNNSQIQSITGRTITFNHNTGKQYSLGYYISFDKKDRLLLGGFYLNVIEKNLRVRAFLLPYFADNIVVDEHNQYWVFSRAGTIDRYALINDSIVHTTIANTVKELDTRFALHWNKDTFCIGTRSKGIIWLTVKNDRAMEIGRLTTTSGLSNNFVSILVKKNNCRQLYAKTGTGLDEITIQQQDTTVQNLAAAYNLFLSFIQLAKNEQEELFAISYDRQLWQITQPFPGHTGFIPDAWFSEISVNGTPVNKYKNSFPYNRNNFRFMVTAPCFNNAAGIRFSFLLGNAGNNWQQVSANNFYQINNLSPGSYTLTVTVQYPGKIYPDKKIVYTFTIKTPVWKRWWFIVLIILAVGGTFWMLLRSYYLRRLRVQKEEAARQQAVEKERNRISRDMHDDLGSGLTKIAILSEVAKKQLSDTVKTREQLERISGSSRELVDSLQDIIWVLNPQNDTLESLAAYTREYTGKFLESMEINIQFNFPDFYSKRNISEEKRRNVFLTVKESLHNIAKHAGCNQVIITLREFPQRFEVIISDNGKGFDPEKVRLFGNGLKNMRNRVEQAGGNYQIHAEPGKGTTTLITMPV